MRSACALPERSARRGGAAAIRLAGSRRPPQPAPGRLVRWWRTRVAARSRAAAPRPPPARSPLLGPRDAVAGDPRGARRRPPGSGRVRPRRLGGLLPLLQDRLEPLPGRIQFLAPHEQRQFAVNDVHDEALVGVPLARL